MASEADGPVGRRVPLLDAARAEELAADEGIPDYLAGLSIFRILLNNPGAAAAVNGMLHRLLWKGSLDARLRELVIMRIAWTRASVYEWTQHWSVARGLGVAEADLLAVRDGPSSERFGPLERAVLTATDETLADGRISEATWTECAGHLGPCELVELVVAIGNWNMVAQLLLSLDVPLEDGVEPWPPDSRTPTTEGGTGDG